MSDLMECKIDGGTWIVGDLTITRERFEEMVPDDRGEYSAVFQHDGWLYYYDGLIPEFDFSHGMKNLKVSFRISPKNIVTKRQT